jgi:hypothetical protein
MIFPFLDFDAISPSMKSDIGSHSQCSLATLPLFNYDVRFVSAVSFLSVVVICLICPESWHWQFPIFRVWLSPSSFASERVCVLSVILSRRLHLHNFGFTSSAWSPFSIWDDHSSGHTRPSGSLSALPEPGAVSCLATQPVKV